MKKVREEISVSMGDIIQALRTEGWPIRDGSKVIVRGDDGWWVESNSEDDCIVFVSEREERVERVVVAR